MKNKIKPIFKKLFITLTVIPLLLISLTQTAYAFPHSPNDFLDPYMPSEFDTNGTIYMIETQVTAYYEYIEITFREPYTSFYVTLGTFMSRFYYNRTLNDVAFLKLPAGYDDDVTQVQFYTPTYEVIDDVGLIMLKKTSTGLYIVFYDRETNIPIVDIQLSISEVITYNFGVNYEPYNNPNAYSIGYNDGFGYGRGYYAHQFYISAIYWAEYRTNIAYTLGYNGGKSHGYQKGYDDGYESAYQENFDRGFRSAGGLVEVYHMPEWVVPLFILGFVVIIGLLVLGSKRGDE